MQYDLLKESIDKEIQYYKTVLYKYYTDQDYCNPNISLEEVLNKIKQLEKDKYLGYKID